MKPCIKQHHDDNGARTASVTLAVSKERFMSSDMHKLTYFDGFADLRIGADDIPFAMHILDLKLVRFFLIRWMDYSDFQVFEGVLEHIKELDVRDSRKWNDQLVLYPCTQGMLVCRKQTWILDKMSDIVCKDHNIWQVAKIPKAILSELITPDPIFGIMMHMYKDEGEVEGERYIVYVRYGDNNSIPIRRANNLRFARAYYKLMLENAPYGYSVSLYDVTDDKDLEGFRKLIELDESVLDPDMNIEEYLETLNEENKLLHDKGRVMKLVRSLC